MSSVDAYKRRLQGQYDSRGAAGIAARGSNIYNATSNAPNSSGNNGVEKNVEYKAPETQESESSTAFRFQPEYDAMRRRLAKSGADATNQRNQAVGRIETTFEDTLRGLQKQHEKSRDQHTYSMADQGILRSGINIQGQADLAEDVQETVGEAGQARAQALEDVEGQYSQALSNVETELQGLELERARVQAEEEQRQAMIRAEQEAQEKALQEKEKLIAKQKEKLQPTKSSTGQYSPVSSSKSSSNSSGSSNSSDSYTVKSGDTASAIARRLGIDLSELQDANTPKSGDWNLIHPGETFEY